MNRSYWNILCALFLFGCGSESTPGDPCKTIDCGPHGQCEQGACLCVPGYQPLPDGTGCKPFGFDRCEGLNCSGLGHCTIEIDRFGLERPVCQCDQGKVQTPDQMDCFDPCAGIDCSPGECQLGETNQALCQCPLGYIQKPDPLGCKEKDTFFYELFQEYEGQKYAFGHSWMTIRPVENGKILESNTSYLIPISTDAALGGEYNSSVRFDPSGQLVEFVQDQQLLFGSQSLRRRLHFTVEPGESENVVLRFESNILDRIWHGDLECGPEVPLPWAESVEYPAFTYERFEPLFFFLLGQRIQFSDQSEQTIDTLLPNFVMRSRVKVRIQGDPQTASIELSDYGTIANYEARFLKEIRYYGDWAKWQEMEDASALQLNLRPLPRNPIEHQFQEPPASEEQECSIQSADGTLLSGTLTLPQGTPKKIAVLMVQSIFPSDRNLTLLHNRPLKEIAAHLAQGGYASLRFDSRGFGMSQGQSNALPERIEEDLDAAYSWLSADERFEAVVLLSHGFATPEALQAAKRLGPLGMVNLAVTGENLIEDMYYRNVKVMELAGAPEDMIASWFRQFRREMEALRDGRNQNDYMDRSAAYWRQLLNLDLLDTSGIALPVLILHGEEDIVLPSTHAQELADALVGSGSKVETHLMPDLSYVFTPGQIDDLWESVHLPFAMDPKIPTLLIQWLDRLEPAGGLQ